MRRKELLWVLLGALLVPAVGLTLGWLSIAEAESRTVTVAYGELLDHPEQYVHKLVRVEGDFLEVGSVVEERTVSQLVGHTGFVPLYGTRTIKQEVPTYVFSAKPREQYTSKDRCIETRGWPEKYLDNGRCLMRGTVMSDGNGGYLLY